MHNSKNKVYLLRKKDANADAGMNPKNVRKS